MDREDVGVGWVWRLEMAARWAEETDLVHRMYFLFQAGSMEVDRSEWEAWA